MSEHAGWSGNMSGKSTEQKRNEEIASLQGGLANADKYLTKYNGIRDQIIDRLTEMGAI